DQQGRDEQQRRERPARRHPVRAGAMVPQPVLGIGTRLGRDPSAPAPRSIRGAQQRTGDHTLAPLAGVRCSVFGVRPEGLPPRSLSPLSSSAWLLRHQASQPATAAEHRTPERSDARRFNIVIVFVIAEKYEILGRLVAGDAEGYDNP